MKPSSKPIIDRDLGTKKGCIAALRRAIIRAQMGLDNGRLHTTIHLLEEDLKQIKKNLPREKITKPFKG